MAMQLIGQLVKVEGYVTVPALGDPAANLADLVRGISPAVLKENDLFAGGQGMRNGFLKLGAENDFAVVPVGGVRRRVDRDAIGEASVYWCAWPGGVGVDVRL